CARDSYGSGLDYW
nr:immunoglobulin heavy chain junction region [Macaca mulatta]MOV38055.1 immunoglobulin heavy chain junction region [Macaca mulatta]MOV38819.1 immunoglobulin heavy chain junction region [Macaca mulatta]MOV38849.1 immunoglobulin heavy chain junction region [Macaca mulatta]MOV39120.1 immunoglobulin heavy chain junction region [Macaca mulatta]